MPNVSCVNHGKAAAQLARPALRQSLGEKTGFVFGGTGRSPSQAGLAKALAWLKTHQDPKGGYWAADSINHKHDAATGASTRKPRN
jgi:hypothetical protein